MMNDDELSDEVSLAPLAYAINGNDFDEQDVFDAVDDVLDNLRETGDMSIADATLRSLIGMQKLSGMGMAKLLWGWKHWWEDTGQDALKGDTFGDYMMTTHGFKSSVVIDRYVLLWDCYEQNKIPAGIRLRPMKDQIAIAQTLEQGYEIPKKAWKQLEFAPNTSEVGAILREVKNKPPRKHTLSIVEERDGTIVCYQGSDSKRHVAAVFLIDEEQIDPVVHAALERFRKNAGVMKK